MALRQLQREFWHQMARILVVGARGIPDVEGGAEKNAEQLFPRMVELGHEVTLLSLEKNVRGASYRGVKLISAPTWWLLNTDKLVYYLAGIVHAVRLRPDVVHLQGLGAALFLWVYKLLGFKVVVRYGSADYILPKWGVLGRAGFQWSEYQLRFADAVISVSQTLTRRLVARGIKARVHFVPNALDAPEPAWTGPHGGRPYVLAVGRVTSQKNIDTLLKAFSQLSRKHPNCDLRVVGSLHDKPYVAKLAGLMSPNVAMEGAAKRSEVPKLLSECAVYVNLSHHEGNSNATLEAISHGCPILVSDIPENREMPLNPNNFVDHRDVDAIVTALEMALANPESLVVERAGFFSWDDVARATDVVYQAVLWGRGQTLKKPSIVFLINSIAGGGAERVMMRLIEYSRDRLSAFDFHLVLLDSEKDAYEIPDWVRVHRLDCRGKTIASLLRLRSLLRELKPQLVMSFLNRSNIANVVISKLLGFRSIISERSNTSAHLEQGLVGLATRFLVRNTYSRADAVIAVSGGIANDLVKNFGVKRDRMFVIANPIDASAIKALASQTTTDWPSRPYIVTMGRFMPVKNFALLLEAFAGSRLTDFDLLILGQGPLEQELKALAANLGLSGRVHFPGFASNPFPLISRGYAYVLSSNYEGFPNGLVEAMVTGIPAISTDCPFGPAEILDDSDQGATEGLRLGKYGLLVPTNDMAAMIDAFHQVIKPGERERLGKAATEGAARYGHEVAVTRYWDVIEETLRLSDNRYGLRR